MTALRSRTLTRGGLLLTTATATALALTAPVTPAFAQEGPGEQAIGLTDGTLDWGVKESFRRYITGPIAHGSATAADGAEATESGFRFTGGTGAYDLGTHAVDTAFDGSVHFLGHDGLLDLKLSAPRVVTEGTAGTLVTDVTIAGETTEDVEFADLDLTGVAPGSGEGGALVFADIPATLTADGAEAFSYNGTPMYAEGTALDPATLTVTPETPGGEDPDGDDPDGDDPDGDDPEGNDPGGDEEPLGPVHDGTLDWGVKESFRSYVTGPIAGGDVELTGGATEIADGYRFPGATGAYVAETPALDAGFDGAVRFTGHDGALDLSFSDLAVDIEGTGGTLIADVSSKDRETGEVSAYQDIAVAELDVPEGALTPDGDVITLAAVPAALTADGAQAFAGFYAEGEELDPVTVTVALTEDADLPTDPNGPGGSDGDDTPGGPAPQGGAAGGALAATGGATDTAALLGAAAALAAAGGAAVHAARRRTTTTTDTTP
ncbi:HtaA domain-containing protein [Streptomyces radicis]|uniref:Htaa domain-containing protein n=1 Tax=Streptomyces radicis TaxID=1750517 RepID=A0A3A9WGJ2_9ACTN|nr:HtaA domain-containing protein [Streptomyces radicis]RKN12148.1 hypothetical protein D7319_04545 [Streptomyces radicis]RKN25799.1 hypothetical protein D7318_05935 [Streptomyces radicis]